MRFRILTTLCRPRCNKILLNSALRTPIFCQYSSNRRYTAKINSEPIEDFVSNQFKPRRNTAQKWKSSVKNSSNRLHDEFGEQKDSFESSGAEKNFRKKNSARKTSSRSFFKDSDHPAMRITGKFRNFEKAISEKPISTNEISDDVEQQTSLDYVWKWTIRVVLAEHIGVIPKEQIKIVRDQPSIEKGGEESYDRPLTEDEAELLRSTVLDKTHRYNVDIAILEGCHSFGLPHLGMSFLEYCIKQGHFNIGTLKAASTFCYYIYLRNDRRFPHPDLLETLLEQGRKWFERNSMIVTSIVRLLCLTGRKEEAIELFQTFPETNRDFKEEEKLYIINLLASAHFDAENGEKGWEIMEDWLKSVKASVPIETETVSSIAAYCRRQNEAEFLAEFKRFIALLGTLRYWPSEIEANEMADLFRSSNNPATQQFVVNSARVDLHHGNCNKCNSELNAIAMTQSDFETLSQSIFSNLLEEGNLYKNTTPGEMERFDNFLENNKQRFDVVIDGLNVLYATNHQEPRTSRRATLIVNNLANVIDCLKSKHGCKNILVVTKGHSFKPIMRTKLTKKATFFFLQTSSNDDAFALYATLKNGPGTRILSNDRFGMQKEMLKSQSVLSLFRVWSAKRHLTYNFDATITLPDGKRELDFDHLITKPTNYEPLCQKNQSTDGKLSFHIPFRGDQKIYHYEFPDNWICIQEK